MQTNSQPPEPTDLRYFDENRSRFPPEQLLPYAGQHVAWSPDGSRILASGKDMDEVEKNMDHSADLTHDMVFHRLLADLHEKGVDVSEPTDPMHDADFIRALIATYTIAPTRDWLTPTAA